MTEPLPAAGGPRAAAHRDGIRVRRLSRWQTQDLRDDLADLADPAVQAVLSKVSAPAGGGGCHDRRDFLDRLDDDIRRPGFALLVAETTTVVGCAFGVPVGRGDLWWRGVDPGRRHEAARLTTGGLVLAVTQVVADPRGQSRAVAQRLQDRLLAVHGAALGLTLVDPADRAVRSAFRSWGWQDIGDVVRYPGPVVRRALVLARDPRAPAASPDPPPHGTAPADGGA
ncbi:hypothetical protein ABZ682_14010 [Streptomyces griseoviridis]|uniref:hypothetical protein n=1 Tax=Streptomyces griseoviridis TaxID=45398 RepID=UPI0033DCA3AE